MQNVDDLTIGQVFDRAVSEHGGRVLISVPPNAQRSYDPDGRDITYFEAAQRVADLADRFKDAGYGHGHRFAVLLENHPEMLLVKLACARLGISWVPVNPDYRPSEIAYLLSDSKADLAICLASRLDQMTAGVEHSAQSVPVHVLGTEEDIPSATTRHPNADPVSGNSEASLLYTSGTTGRPKGCILSHEYELSMGAWYSSRGGHLSFDPKGERVYCPLPLFHVNAAILLFFGMVLTGGCQIIPERFSRTHWWREVRNSRATGIHYLGVIIPVLMNEPVSVEDKDHSVKWGLGAGVEPSLHGAFEDRFGFPLIEVWGMTEMCRILANCHEPRHLHTRAMGKPQPGLEVRVVDEIDNDVPQGESGELLVRHSELTPRKGAFSGYLNLPEETEQAWRGGWFHTGDTVRQDEDGMVYFVDRKKNIIRRSGENIAAAEVEACLQGHALVSQVAVIAIEDDIRDEEVMACVVPVKQSDETRLGKDVFAHAFKELAYYKAPGWIVFVDALPVTGTQKVLKHMIFEEGLDPRQLPRAHDFRNLKKRS